MKRFKRLPMACLCIGFMIPPYWLLENDSVVCIERSALNHRVGTTAVCNLIILTFHTVCFISDSEPPKLKGIGKSFFFSSQLPKQK